MLYYRSTDTMSGFHAYQVAFAVHIAQAIIRRFLYNAGIVSGKAPAIFFLRVLGANPQFARDDVLVSSRGIPLHSTRHVTFADGEMSTARRNFLHQAPRTRPRVRASTHAARATARPRRGQRARPGHLSFTVQRTRGTSVNV